MTKQEFYSECARVIGIRHERLPVQDVGSKIDRETGALYRPATRAGRFRGRQPGNGRFPGFGLIRIISERHVHVSLRHPVQASRSFGSYELALDYLRQVFCPMR